jgi:hypothetical protein
VIKRETPSPFQTVPRLKSPTPTSSPNLINQNKPFPSTIRDDSLKDGKLERYEAPQPGTVRDSHRSNEESPALKMSMLCHSKPSPFSKAEFLVLTDSFASLN